MKLWLAKNSEISLREQLTRQIMLAIISGDLQPGDKLPSVREIALRHKIHANTASAAYRRLEEDEWVESRQGSGVYVRRIAPAQIAETTRAIESELDAAILLFLKEARRRGFENKQLKARLNFWLPSKAPQKIVIIEDDVNLSRIIARELDAHFAAPVSHINFAAAKKNNATKNSLVVSLSDAAENFSVANSFIKLKLNSVQESMRGQAKPAATDLIGVASQWQTFLRWSQTMLVAVGIDEANLVVRDAGETGWKKGLTACKFVITDSLTAKSLPAEIDKRIFNLISAESIEELRNQLK